MRSLRGRDLDEPGRLGETLRAGVLEGEGVAATREGTASLSRSESEMDAAMLDLYLTLFLFSALFHNFVSTFRNFYETHWRGNFLVPLLVN